MTSRALIFGASGQVGSALRQIAPSSMTVVAHDLDETDIRDRSAVDRAIADAQPELIINCAAFTNVDGAESRADEAMEANGIAPGIIADAAQRARVRFFHLSTDYVFDGCAHTPYRTDAVVGPLSVYGATKLEGERRVLAASPDSVVVRTAWVHSGGGANFVRTAVRFLAAGKPMRVVDDQVGTPTRALHLADVIEMAHREGPHGAAGELPEAAYVPDYAALTRPSARSKLLTGAAIAAGVAVGYAASRRSRRQP